MMPNEVSQLLERWTDGPTARKLLAGLALTAISCSEDKSPTAPATTDSQAPPTAAVTGRAALLTNVPVTGLSKPEPAVLTDVLPDQFAGTLTRLLNAVPLVGPDVAIMRSRKAEAHCWDLKRQFRNL